MTRSASEKFEVHRRIPFGKGRTVDQTHQNIVAFLAEEKAPTYLFFYLFDHCKFRWDGPRTVGKLLRKILHPDYLKKVRWSNDAKDTDLPMIPEELQRFIEVAIDTMLDSAELAPNERPEWMVIEFEIGRVLSNKRYYAANKGKKRPTDPDMPSTSASKGHKKKHSRLTTLVCSKCSKRLHTVQLLQRHVKAHHPEEGDPAESDLDVRTLIQILKITQS